LESGFLGLVGGVIGCFLGLLGAKIIEHFAIELGFTFKLYFDPKIIIFSILFSFFVGIISGFLPSYHASKMNPIEALRT